VLPLAVLMAGPGNTVQLSLAALLCLTWLLAERWLLFAEAQHVVCLYHGAARVT
jgi:hypothetical protein